MNRNAVALVNSLLQGGEGKVLVLVKDGACQTDAMGASGHPCAVCLQAPSTQAFAPCGHRCLCDGCAKSSTGGRDGRSKFQRCPLCRDPSTNIFRVFIGDELISCREEVEEEVEELSIPEWRRDARKRQITTRRNMPSRWKLDQILFSNTTRQLVQRQCETQATQCQTEVDCTLFEQCRVCKVQPPTHASLPCGHCCLCANCSESTTLCPLCDEPRLEGVRIFD